MIFRVQILGCGSAVPKLHRNATSQYVNVLERHILIDCGEGTQLQMQKFKVKPQKLSIILISHLHGDHYLGLIGLLSSMHLGGRSKPIKIFAPEGLEEIIKMHLHYSRTTLAYELEFYELNKTESELIFEDKCIEIKTIPLKHRIYCNGFLICEKDKPKRLNPQALKQYKVPVAMMHKLTEGLDWELDNGNVIKNSLLTLEPSPNRSYAYCSDTKYTENIIEVIQGVDLLYHEATFLSDKEDRAKQTYHSTAKQAARIAQKSGAKKLVLGHFSARYDDLDAFITEAQLEFKNVYTVQDGDIIDL